MGKSIFILVLVGLLVVAGCSLSPTPVTVPNPVPEVQDPVVLKVEEPVENSTSVMPEPKPEESVDPVLPPKSNSVITPISTPNLEPKLEESAKPTQVVLSNEPPVDVTWISPG